MNLSGIGRMFPDKVWKYEILRHRWHAAYALYSESIARDVQLGLMPKDEAPFGLEVLQGWQILYIKAHEMKIMSEMKTAH